MYLKNSSWFLAVSMLLFGVLKFVNPFKGWYSIQISASGLPPITYPMGILGEIAVGAVLIFCLLYPNLMSRKTYFSLTTGAFFTIVLMMLTGTFVHLHPDVPAEVLPLKIKPPYIPIFFLLLSISNLYLSVRESRGKRT